MTRICIIFFMSLFLFACSVNKNSESKYAEFNISNYFCEDHKNDANDDSLTVEKLYTEMKTCIVKEKYSPATVLFATAGSLSWFQAANSDSAQLRDKHANMLKPFLHDLDKNKREAFWMSIQKTLGDSGELSKLCQKLVNLKSDVEKANSYTTPKESWNSALSNYLYCPTQ